MFRGAALQEAHTAEIQRLLYVGFTRAKRALILAEASKSSLATLPSLNGVMDPEQEFEGALHGAAYIARNCDGVPEAPDARRAATTWFEEAPGPAQHIARYWSPSKAEPVPCEVHAEKLPGDHPFPAIETGDGTTLGQAVHGFLAAWPAMRGLGQEAQEAHAALALRRWGRGGDLEPAAMVAAAKRLDAWAQQATPGASWLVEVPVSGPRVEGGQWNGIIDLVLVGAGGSMIVDHKSADWGESGWEAKASQYSGQLQVYALLGGVGRTAIHMPLGGSTVEVTP